MKRRSVNFLVASLGLGLAFNLLNPVLAQSFPAQPVRIIFELTRLDRAFPIAISEQEGVAALSFRRN